MKLFVTTYALTAGIMEVEAEIASTSSSMIVWRNAGVRYDSHSHGEGKQWHRTREAAVVKANAMKVAKIASMKQSLKKLESLTF